MGDVTFSFKLNDATTDISLSRSALGLADESSDSTDPPQSESILTTMARKRWASASSGSSSTGAVKKLDINLDGEVRRPYIPLIRLLSIHHSLLLRRSRNRFPRRARKRSRRGSSLVGEAC